jgi:hypothetical protein
LRRVAQSPPSYELVVVQDGSVEAPIELEGEEIVSVVAGESAAGVHLALGLSDGNVRILSECVLPTTTFSPACSTLVALAPHIQSFASPLLADFDLSRCSDAPDLLSFDDATRSAWITRGAGPSENMIALTSVADDFPHVELGLEVSEHDASTIRVTTYEWPVIPESGWRRIGEPFDVEANPITHVAFDLPPSSASQAFVFEIVLVADGHGPDRGLEALYCMLVDGDGCYAMGAPPSSLCIPPQACPTGNGSRGVIQIPGGLRCQIPNCGN